MIDSDFCIILFLFGVWNLEWIIFDVQVLRQFNNAKILVHSLSRVQMRSSKDESGQKQIANRGQNFNYLGKF